MSKIMIKQKLLKFPKLLSTLPVAPSSSCSSSCYIFNIMSLIDAAVDGDLMLCSELLANYEVNCSEKLIALCAASKYGHLSVVELLLQSNVDINSTFSGGDAPLHVASKFGEIEVVQYLVQQNADINQVNDDGLSALSLALYEDQETVVEYLINMRAHIQAQDANKVSILLASTGNLDMLKTLLNKFTFVNCSSLLYFAAENGRLNVIAYLLTLPNIDVDYGKSKDFTPLMIACNEGYLDIVQYLLSHNANMNNCIPTTGSSVLHIAAKTGRKDIVDCLLEHNAVIDQTNAFGSTALHVAIAKSHQGVVETLVTHNANVNILNKRGTSPLQSAVSALSITMVKYLINHNADVNMCDVYTEGSDVIGTALHSAAFCDDIEIVEYLLAQNADINKTTAVGYSPLMVALLHEQENAAEYLIQHNAQVLIATDDNLTSLHAASTLPNPQTIRLILDAVLDSLNINCIDDNKPI